MTKNSSTKLRPVGTENKFPPAIGLTGGIGSGKSMVARVFEVLGIPVYYADNEAKRLMNSDPGLKEAILKTFGEKAYDKTGLDRKFLSSVVFNDQAQLEKLNALVHPVTIRDAEEWRKRQSSPYIIKEAALLFESGANRYLHKVIGVSAPLDLRLKRVMGRDKITREEVLKRIEGQMDETRKMKMCDFVVINDEVEMIIPQILEIHRFLLA